MTSDLATRLIFEADMTVGVREKGGRNRGAEIDEYVRNVGLDPTGQHSWCAAWLYTIFIRATRALGLKNPCPRTARALAVWEHARPEWRMPKGAIDPERLGPGWVFVEDHGAGQGHTGLSEGFDFQTGVYQTISGNTNAAGSREGTLVGRHTKPLGDPKLLGFVDFSQALLVA